MESSSSVDPDPTVSDKHRGLTRKISGGHWTSDVQQSKTRSVPLWPYGSLRVQIGFRYGGTNLKQPDRRIQ